MYVLTKEEAIQVEKEWDDWFRTLSFNHKSALYELYRAIGFKEKKEAVKGK